jgi:ketosteroid isomerase-like protein
MKQVNTFFIDLYNHFNAREIEAVIANVTEDVQWANGMEGGYVYGKEELRQYWLRQFTMINPTVTPLDIKQEGDTVKIQVHQVVLDLDQQLLADVVVEHIFQFRAGKIARFDIGEQGN